MQKENSEEIQIFIVIFSTHKNAAFSIFSHETIDARGTIARCECNKMQWVRVKGHFVILLSKNWMFRWLSKNFHPKSQFCGIIKKCFVWKNHSADTPKQRHLMWAEVNFLIRLKWEISMWNFPLMSEIIRRLENKNNLTHKCIENHWIR